MNVDSNRRSWSNRHDRYFKRLTYFTIHKIVKILYEQFFNKKMLNQCRIDLLGTKVTFMPRFNSMELPFCPLFLSLSLAPYLLLRANMLLYVWNFTSVYEAHACAPAWHVLIFVLLYVLANFPAVGGKRTRFDLLDIRIGKYFCERFCLGENLFGKSRLKKNSCFLTAIQNIFLYVSKLRHVLSTHCNKPKNPLF